MFIFSDESGDLGWTLDKPYRNGGSSRHLTIGSYLVDPVIAHLPKRLIKDLYQKFNWNPQKEKKWADMGRPAREYFATEALKIATKHPTLIKYLSITAKKENVDAHIRQDPNKLYNYMLGISLLDIMSEHDNILFCPDPRSIKVGSGNSLHEYLQAQLAERKAKTILRTQPLGSSENKNVQFADMLAGLVQSHFEDGNSEAWHILRNKIRSIPLFFPGRQK
jgi:hypothetical protein